jgi:hypothetical protein
MQPGGSIWLTCGGVNSVLASRARACLVLPMTSDLAYKVVTDKGSRCHPGALIRPITIGRHSDEAFVPSQSASHQTNHGAGLMPLKGRKRWSENL